MPVSINSMPSHASVTALPANSGIDVPCHGSSQPIDTMNIAPSAPSSSWAARLSLGATTLVLATPSMYGCVRYVSWIVAPAVYWSLPVLAFATANVLVRRFVDQGDSSSTTYNRPYDGVYCEVAGTLVCESLVGAACYLGLLSLPISGFIALSGACLGVLVGQGLRPRIQQEAASSAQTQENNLTGRVEALQTNHCEHRQETSRCQRAELVNLLESWALVEGQLNKKGLADEACKRILNTFDNKLASLNIGELNLNTLPNLSNFLPWLD